MSESIDTGYMRRALELAAHGLNNTDPNPRVGCVIVRQDRIIGEGWHERAGEAHAEVRALAAAGDARAATAFVTLEPCSHTGRTPPCINALIAAQVRRVVYAVDDPNPLVSGAGAAALRAAGIDVQGGVLDAEARALNPGFFKRHLTGLPWVRVKLAASLDGRTALANGESRWITSKAARQDGQRYRARSSVVLSGSGTVLADDPALNVRIDDAMRQPLRVVLDTSLRVPPQSRMFDREGPSLVYTASTDAARHAELTRRGVQVETVERSGNGLQLESVLRRLAQRQANEVWVEAGARLAGALVHSGLVDELVIYLAPSLLGPEARPLMALPGITRLEDRLQLRFTSSTFIDGDLRLTAIPLVSPAGTA
jgi:diaminohydroxyphosphoribosylaminopyrimidine deaminase / 5-amino-6-(5-phosphoribosylamino)uracil reductase